MDFHNLFVGLQLDGVQMERNESGQFKGTAIVSFGNVQDCEMALKMHLSPSQPWVIWILRYNSITWSNFFYQSILFV